MNSYHSESVGGVDYNWINWYDKLYKQGQVRPGKGDLSTHSVVQYHRACGPGVAKVVLSNWRRGRRRTKRRRRRRVIVIISYHTHQ